MATLPWKMHKWKILKGFFSLPCKAELHCLMKNLTLKYASPFKGKGSTLSGPLLCIVIPRSTTIAYIHLVNDSLVAVKVEKDAYGINKK